MIQKDVYSYSLIADNGDEKNTMPSNHNLPYNAVIESQIIRTCHAGNSTVVLENHSEGALLALRLIAQHEFFITDGNAFM